MWYFEFQILIVLRVSVFVCVCLFLCVWCVWCVCMRVFVHVCVLQCQKQLQSLEKELVVSDYNVENLRKDLQESKAISEQVCIFPRATHISCQKKKGSKSVIGGE